MERHLPGLIRATNEWLRVYKIPDGKPENQFAFSGEAKNKKYAVEVIHECHEAWKRLMRGEADAGDVSIANSSVQGSKGFVHPGDVAIQSVPPANPLPPAPIDPSVNKTFFLSSNSLA